MSGPECYANPPEMNSSSGNGSIEEIGGLKAYVTGNRSANLAILLASDAFGYEGVMLRKLADKISALGYLVVVPDFFFGGHICTTSPPQVRANWLHNHPPEKGCENARKIIAQLKSRGVFGVGAAGFCWGGMMVAKLAKYDDIKAGVILHPGRLTDDDINEVNVPIAILGGELDKLCPQEEVKHYGDILSSKQVESFVKIFPGVSHGWASRYSEDDEVAVMSAQEAHTDMLNWLTKYVTF
ncbi:endo-1,3;1,4-beta-D-glucanase-like isoform X2 [Cynara cardunculus var. scolymus]|uniref:endo-1,3;1,4-beta-D-glucanase-like isoform X2 n=1 Tax=Cynara cardunculus var. scolymus TaxID=59895 RepID=UPI000D626F80|nr:endo-1,3;1,4-beta-D-glucanase-like isoform X2 [Cynara cardunculus var. scolymus]